MLRHCPLSVAFIACKSSVAFICDTKHSERSAPQTRLIRADGVHCMQRTVHSMPDSTRSNTAWHANSACYEPSNCPSTSSCVATLPPSFGAQVIVLRGNRLGLNRHGETNDAGLHAIAQTMYALHSCHPWPTGSHPNRSPAAAYCAFWTAQVYAIRGDRHHRTARPPQP